MKLGNLCSLSSSPYCNNSNNRSVSSLKNACKTKDYSAGSVSDRDSVSGRSRRSRIRKGSNGSIKPAKTMSKKLDFTNLAYREAVGRLKFLLEESYSPAIKPPSQYRKHCIEDSGEETDNQSQVTDRPPLSEISRYLTTTSHKSQVPKKAMKSYSPHRTARYTGSGDYSVPPPPPPVPAASEVGQAPPEIINFIEKQEDYIEQLEKESKFCRDELSNLLGKVRDVISENEALTEQARSDLAGHMGHHTKFTTSSESDDNHYSKTSRSRKDKPSKPTTSLCGPSIVFESRISELEAELAQANIDLKKLRNENMDLKRKSNLGDEGDFATLEAYRRRVENLERDKFHLEENCKKLQRKVEDLHSESSQATTKTKRDREMAEMANFEKSQAEMEIRRLKEDLERQHERIRELQHEMTRRIAEERTNAERRYHYHVDQLGGDLSSQWDQASKLQLELERQKRFEADLKRELAQRNTQIESLKQELKDSKMAYLTDLTHINAEKQSLEQEITSLRLQLDKAERQAKVEAARLNAEINSLRQRLDRADADILQARRENLKLNDEIANLEKDLALGELKGEIRPTTKEINKTIMDIEKKHAETVSELEDMIQSQRQLMDKLTTECKTLTSKLEETSLTHNEEKKDLRKTNDMLLERLKHVWSSYKGIGSNAESSFSENDNASPNHDDTSTQAKQFPLTTISQPHSATVTTSQHQSTQQQETIHQLHSLLHTTTIHQLMTVPSAGQHQHLPKPTSPPTAMATMKKKRTQTAKITAKLHEKTLQSPIKASHIPVLQIISNPNIQSNQTQLNSIQISNTNSQATRNTINSNTESQTTTPTTTSLMTYLSSNDPSSNTMTTMQPTTTKRTAPKLIYTQAIPNSHSTTQHHLLSHQFQPDNCHNQRQPVTPPSHQLALAQSYSPIQQQPQPHQSLLSHWAPQQQEQVDSLDYPPATSKATINRERALTIWGRQLDEMGSEERTFCRNSLPRQPKECQRHQSEIRPLTESDIDPYDLIPDFDISSPSLFERSSDEDANGTDDTLERTVINQSP